MPHTDKSIHWINVSIIAPMYQWCTTKLLYSCMSPVSPELVLISSLWLLLGLHLRNYPLLQIISFHSGSYTFFNKEALASLKQTILHHFHRPCSHWDFSTSDYCQFLYSVLDHLFHYLSLHALSTGISFRWHMRLPPLLGVLFSSVIFIFSMSMDCSTPRKESLEFFSPYLSHTVVLKSGTSWCIEISCPCVFTSVDIS